MITWNYRMFRDPDGFCIREVFYLENGEIGGCRQEPIAPFGETLEELIDDINTIKEALSLPILTLEEVDASAAKNPKPKTPTGPTISLAELRTKLDLEAEPISP